MTHLSKATFAQVLCARANIVATLTLVPFVGAAMCQRK